MSEETALSETTALSEETALSGTPSYPTLLGSHRFVLDAWHVYPTRNLIQHRHDGGDSRQLEPRLMRLLCLLAASADAVVTREQIINSLWPRVVVNENSLTRAVSDLRRVLTPSGDKRTDLIQTIPKRGYRLTQAPEAIRPQEVPHAQQSVVAARSGTQWLKRWAPGIAASFILALALITRVSDDGANIPVVAQLPTTEDSSALPRQPLIDQIIGNTGQLAGRNADATSLPASLPQGSQAPFPMITRLGYAPDADRVEGHASIPGQSMLTPDGQLLAYVDYRDGVASLNLRPTMSDAEPWVAFTTDERILHLQWSPLDAGILMTVGQITDSKERASYLRLMLLDLETLRVQELYRRDLPAQDRSNGIGNIT